MRVEEVVRDPPVRRHGEEVPVLWRVLTEPGGHQEAAVDAVLKIPAAPSARWVTWMVPTTMTGTISTSALPSSWGHGWSQGSLKLKSLSEGARSIEGLKSRATGRSN